MRFLSILFTLLTLLSAAWVCGGSYLTTNTVSQFTAPDDPSFSHTDNQSIQNAAKGITGGLGLGFFACTGVPAFMFFALLAFICNSSAQRERRHQEMLAAQMVRNDALGNMATFQAAQAQMQYQQMQNQQRGPVMGKFPDEIERDNDAEWIKRQNKERQSKLDKYR